MMIKTKQFQANFLRPLATPDGSSLEEIVNTFLATLDAKDVLDVINTPFSGGKYGLITTYIATVVYRT
jgi:hypothetical protein